MYSLFIVSTLLNPQKRPVHVCPEYPDACPPPHLRDGSGPGPDRSHGQEGGRGDPRRTRPESFGGDQHVLLADRLAARPALRGRSPQWVTIAAIEEARSGDDQVEAADLKEPLARLPSKRERTIDSVCRARHGADPPAVVDVHGNVMRLEHPADQPVERRVVAGELVG